MTNIRDRKIEKMLMYRDFVHKFYPGILYWYGLTVQPHGEAKTRPQVTRC